MAEMNPELRSLLSYLEDGYVLVSGEGLNAPLADKVSTGYATLIVQPKVVAESVMRTGEHPNARHLIDS